MNHLPTLEVPVRGRLLLLYLASNSQAIGALLAQEDNQGNKQPIYYVSRTLKYIETRYPIIEKACLVIIYASQRLKRYFSTHQILLVTKSHPIKALLHQPLLTGRIAQWLVLLSQYDIGIRTPKTVKSQAIADLLAQFPGKEEGPLSEEIPGEVAVTEIPGKKWTMKFDRSATTTSNGVGIVLSCENGDTIPLSFKHGFLCSNNAAEYEAYLTGLTIALSIGVKHMRVLGDSNLVVSQVKDWRVPFIEYLAKGILPTDRTLAHQLKKLADRYFLQNDILFKQGYNEDPLRCLGPKEAREVVREVQSSDCESHPGKRRLYKQLLLLGYYWPTMKSDSEELVKTYYACQVLGDAIHTHLNVLQDMMTLWPFHTWGLDLTGPISPPSNGYIWILVATKYFTK
ncbi:uncharacterized protein LOC126707134 [Quercus robur]|uniref:uncharacterized protein LOC126707134 n=1 Tax=Quercus robur TaxID=38942 RepID=UPI002163E276|nr:uncharacterized protein LOC126707134 [Quercus robur]